MGGYGGGVGHYSKYTQQVSFREPGRTDNVKTVYPPINTVCGGIKIKGMICKGWLITIINKFPNFQIYLILRLYISYNNIRCNTTIKVQGFMATYREREKERERERERMGVPALSN